MIKGTTTVGYFPEEACVPASDFDHLIARIDTAIRGVGEVYGDVSVAADKLFGSAPTAPTGQGNKSSQGGGYVGRMHSLLDDLENAISGALNEARRLNRL